MKFSCKVGERSYAVELEGSQTVLEGKQFLTTAAPESNGVLQRWIFRGRILTDASLLSETGIGEGEVVIVIPGKNAAAAPSAMTQGAPSSSSLPAQSLQGNLYAAPDPMVTNNSRMLTMQMDSAMSMLLNSPTEVVEAAVSTMLKITTNIITSPLEEKYRRIPQTNANFNAKLGSVAGGRQLMQAVGFEATGDAWVLVPSADKWPVLVACHQKLLAFSERLKRSMSSPPDAPTQAPQAAAAPAPAATTPTPPTPPPADAPAAIPQDQLLALVASLSLAASSGSSSSSSSSGGGGGNDSGGSSSGDGSGGSAPDGASQG